MLISFVLIAIAGLAHFWGPSVLPVILSHGSPSLAWLCTVSCLWAISKSFSAVIVIAQCIACTHVYEQYGSSTALLRIVYLPLLASFGGAFVAWHFEGVRNGWIVAVILVFLQLWSSFSAVVMLACYPATLLSFIMSQKDRDRVREKDLKDLSEAGVKYLTPAVRSRNGAFLDTLVIQPPQPTKRWLLYVGGNAAFLELSIKSNYTLAEKLNANLILYNPRGTGQSAGYVSTVSNLVEDAVAVARYCMETYSIEPNYLLLFGHSIGGGVVSELASQWLHGSPLVIDRSFSRLSDIAALFSPLSPSLTKRLFPWLVGDFDGVKAWNAMRHDKKLIIFSKRDEIISFAVSLAAQKQFLDGESGHSMVIELKDATESLMDYHNSPLSMFKQADEVYRRINSLYPTASS